MNGDNPDELLYIHYNVLLPLAKRNRLESFSSRDMHSMALMDCQYHLKQVLSWW